MAMAMMAWLHATTDVVTFFLSLYSFQSMELQFKCVEGCFLMAAAQDEAGRRVPLAHRSKVDFLSRRTGPYPAEKESTRSAASERTPLSSTTSPLTGWVRRG